MKHSLTGAYRNLKLSGAAIWAATALMAMEIHLAAQTTAFTYQGRLTAQGAAAQGSYDFEFQLYSAATGGSALGLSVTNENVAVSNGLFSALLDFGPEAFDGGSRWLEIAVRTNGGANFTTLDPRQLLTSAPAAIYAGTAATALSLAGTVPSANLGGSYGSAVSFNNVSNSFSGDGSGLVHVPGAIASQLPSGTSVQAAPNTAYILTNSQTVTVTLPPAPQIGDIVRVAGIGLGGWILAQNDGQLAQARNLVNPSTPWDQLLSAKTLQGQTLSSSADGVHIIAGFAGSVAISSDSGGTWTFPSNQPIANSASVALSSGGQDAAEAIPHGQIYLSSDSGNNWTLATNSVVANYSGIAISSDGAHLAAVVNGGGIYTSANFGIDWTATSAVSNQWTAVASSADGSSLVAASRQGGIYRSTNFGANWQVTTAPLNNSWSALTASSDAGRIVALAGTTNAWISTDSGQYWQASTIGSDNYGSVAGSADGLQLAAIGSTTIAVSADGGLTWLQSHAPALAWRAVASSAAGNFFATGYDIGIWGFRTSTSLGVNGYLTGGPDSAVELQYVGHGQFLPLSHEGALLTH
ncbi:MAG TPA: hypothetical protein VHB20_02345 [Verrucomicrobiae bacterium]|jgi:hypothetical protein|nr:hypothetical protein [Verrucomicrobiae bacterium]